jgi:hypothetical protein
MSSILASSIPAAYHYGGKADVLPKNRRDLLNYRPYLVDETIEESRKITSIATGVSPGRVRSVPDGNAQTNTAEHPHLRIWFTGDGPSYFSSICYLPRLEEGIDLDSGIGWVGEMKIPAAWSCGGKPEHSMLICIRERPENSKRGRDSGIGPMVRLYGFYGVACCGGELTELDGVPPKFFRIVCNDESELVFLGGRILPRFVDRDCIDEVIQSGPKIVDAVSENQSPIEQLWGIAEFNDEGELGSAFVETLEHPIRFVFCPFKDKLLDLFQVNFCSSEFGIDVG